MIKLRKGYELIYFEKLTDYYVAVIDDGENQTEFTANSIIQLKIKINNHIITKSIIKQKYKLARKDCKLPDNIINFCKGDGEDSMVIENIIMYKHIWSMGKTNGFKIIRKKIKNHIGKYKITRLTNN